MAKGCKHRANAEGRWRRAGGRLAFIAVDRSERLGVHQCGRFADGLVTTYPSWHGVTVPAGPTSPTISGSYAFTQLMAMKNQLTPEQQTVLRELLDATHSTLPANAPALPQFQPPQPTL